MTLSLLPPPPALYPGYLDAIGGGGGAVTLASFASAAWPAANRAIFLPFAVAVPSTAVQLYCLNGATASGNVDMGIYDPSGTRLVSIGSTAQSGTNVLQLFDITDTVLGPGAFYLGIALDGTTGTMFRANIGPGSTRAFGVVQMASAFALPAAATYAAAASGYIPFCGIVFSPRSSI